MDAASRGSMACMTASPASPAAIAVRPAAGTRGWRIALALTGSLWALFLLPMQMVEFAGSGTPDWMARWNTWDGYDAVRAWVVGGLGTSDLYLVFGAASSLSFLAIGVALLPDLRTIGTTGTALGWLIIGTAPLVVISYVNHAREAPLRALWGSEFFLLVAIGVLAIVAAVAARRVPAWTGWPRWLLGCTLPILAVGLLCLGYWPHGPLVTFGVEAAVLIAGLKPRA